MIKRTGIDTRSIVFAVIGALGLLLSASVSDAAQVKLSVNGICHPPNSKDYIRTRRFTEYATMEECLKHGRPAGGDAPMRPTGLDAQDTGAPRSPEARLPSPLSRSGSFAVRDMTTYQPTPFESQTYRSDRVEPEIRDVTAPPSAQTLEANGPFVRDLTKAPERPYVPASTYSRYQFGEWTDDDADCLNTRAEVLSQLSTGLTTMRGSGCTVGRGRWLDPYTNQIFTDAADLDIDHLVPLAYAWSRGADRWTKDERVHFANDMRNLFAVEATVNRAKGARGPSEWLPPNPAFRCEYVLRFLRIAKTYNLHIPAGEARNIAGVQDQVCGS